MSAEPGTLLARTPTGRELAEYRPNMPTGWLFPGADELFRGIYTRAGMGFTSEVVAVCSAVSGEGRSTVSVGLAVVIAQDFPERRVLLVETDTQRPALAEDFGLAPTPGLLDCMLAGEPVQTALRPTFLDNLHVLPIGGTDAIAGRPLRSARMAGVVEDLRHSYEIIILDLPPVLANSDAVLLTDLADGTICVVRSGLTPMSMVNKAVEQLDPAKLRGVVLNANQSSLPGWLQRIVGG